MACKKKGLSTDEKVAKIEEFFVEHPEPFTMKELLALIPKAKGVIPQSIEECVELLISERRAASEKIGVSVFFWRFVTTPSSGTEASRSSYASLSVAELRQRINALRTSETELTETIATREGLLGDGASRQERRSLLSSLEMELRSLQQSLADAAEHDPRCIQQVMAAVTIAQDASNRWSDNVFLLEQHCVQRQGIDRSTFRKLFHIPPQFDYVGPPA